MQTLLSQLSAFDSFTAPDAQPLLRQARRLISEFETRIPELPANELLSQLDSYDLLHRIVYRRPAPDEPQNAAILRVFRARLQGDRSISDALLYRAIKSRIRQRQAAFLTTPLRWLALTLEEWFNAARDGDLEPDSEENRLRIDLLRTSDLRAFTLDQAAFKASLV
ncbi:MAG: hypothetical protein K2I56_06445 [Muribaculaceae bacterium]|nr:hypothetical protein [Muribaculaceae bacterium]